MKGKNLLKSTLCLIMAMLCNVAWAQIEVSTSVDTPENTYSLLSKNGVYMSVGTGATQYRLGRFAFYAAEGENTYKIYSVDAKKWVSYTKADSYGDGANKATLVDGRDDAHAWKVTANGNYYNIAPYRNDGAVAGRYWNFYGGAGASNKTYIYDDNKTVGFYDQAGDGGSLWTLEKLTLATEEQVNAAKALIAVAPGYPKTTSSVYVAMNALTYGVSSTKHIDLAVPAYKTATDIILPEDGKAYTFTALFQNGIKLYMKYVNGQKVSLSTNSTEASVFVCKELSSVNANEKKFAFITADGKILTWVGKDANQNFYKEGGQLFGYSSNYATVYQNKSDWNDITVKKNDTHEEQFGLLRMVGRRSTTENTLFSSFYANKGGGFEQAGDGNLFNSDNTSAWIFTEVEHTNTTAQDLALAKIDAKEYVKPYAGKVGNGIGYAYYLVGGQEQYTDVNAAIDAATTVDAVNEIKNSFKFKVPQAGVLYALYDETHSVYLDIHHLGVETNDASYTQLATLNTAKQFLYITGNETDGTWKIHTTSEGGSYLHQSSNRSWNSWVSDAGSTFKWEVEPIVENEHLVYKLKNVSGSNNGYLGADNHTANSSLYVNSNNALKLSLVEATPEEDLAYTKNIVKLSLTEHTAKLKNQPGYYSCTINGTKVYDAAGVNAAIDAAQTKEAVAEIAEAVKAPSVVLPEIGKAYTMTLVANDANKTQYKIIATDGTLEAKTEGENSVFYCLQSNSNDYPYIFVSEDGYVLGCKKLVSEYYRTDNRHNFKVGTMVNPTSGGKITSNAADRLGMVYITTAARDADTGGGGVGCLIFKYTANSTTAWDNSSAPYHDGTYTSAIIMTEVENYEVPAAQQTKVDAILGKDALKTQVEGIKNELKNQPGYYYCTIDGEKVYDADAILALIDATQSLKTLNEISTAVTNKHLITPEVGKYYRIKGKTSGNYIDAVNCYSGDQMGMKAADACNYLGTIFLLDEGNRLMNIGTGTYVKGTRHIGADKNGANTWTFTLSSTGCFNLTAAGGESGNSTQLHANQGNRADRCSSICTDGTHDFIIEEVPSYALTIDAPAPAGATATWNGETKALPATWTICEGMTITNPELTLNCDNVNYNFEGLFEGSTQVELPSEIATLEANRNLTAKFTPAFFSKSTKAEDLVPVQIYNMRDKGYTICLNNAADYKNHTVNSGTTEYALNEVWYLVGNAESFKMYSHTAGMDLALTLAGNTEGSAATMTANGTELSLITKDDYYYITPKTNANQSLNMSGGKGNDIKLYRATDGGSSWGINVMDITHSLTYSVTVSGTPWDDRYGVGELTFNVKGISSNTHITESVAAQTCYLPKNATFTLSSIPYRGYTFSVPGGAESYEGTLAEGNLTIDLAYTANEEKILYHTPDANGKPYRIPAIAAAPNGHIFAIADNRPCGKDIGYGEVDIKCRISKDNGETWGEEFFIADGQGGDTNEMTTGYGDAAVVADRESNKLLVMMVCGKTVCHDGRWDKSKIGDTDATAVNRVARIYLTYNEETGEWDKSEIVEMTDHIYSLFLNGETPTVTSMFIGSGKICQSRVVKKDKYYRLYCSMWTRDGGNRVIYSDDFGGTWNVLGTINDRPASGGDEPKVEELADGTVVLSSRKYNGRYFNLFTFSDNTYTTGTWGTAVASNEVANGLSFGGNSTNGEIYKVTVMHKESKRICDLMFQSVPTGSGRDNVAIFYKELDESTTYTPTTIAQDWTKGKHVSYKSSCYSTMIMQADGRIAFLFEEAPHEYCIVYIPYTIEDLTGGAYCYVKPIIKQDLYNTSKGDGVIPPYRIPGITTAYNGRLITAAARLVCGTDPGYGQVDVVCRTSDNNGDTWSDMIDVAVGNGVTSATVNYFETAFGDPAIVADRTSNEVLIIAVAGCTVYMNGNTTRQNPNLIATIHSTDNGETWGEPVNATESIYSLFDSGNPIQSAFVGGGKIFQSRIVKVGKYYRLYAAMCARPNGNRVIYSDDFGRTWHALGGASALPAPGGDEPKCEELPDGRVILSSRVGGGRIYNIYTYSNTETAEGSWGTDVKSTFAGSGLTPGGNSTNGEILIVPVKRNSDGKEMYLALQSLPTGGGRTNVGIFYKELTDMTDINTVANFAADWNGFFQVSNTSSAYSSMDLQADNRIGFIYEETLTGFGKRDNPVSTSFPNGEGQHNFDGFDNIYVAYPLEYITDGAYSIKRSVDRREFLRSYFTDLTADAVDEVKAKMTTALNALSAEPTIAEVDKLNLIAAVAQEAEGTWYCFRFEEKRTTGGNVVPVNSWGYIGDNLTATATPAKNGSYFWQKIDAGNGKFHLKSMNGKYLVPASTLTTSTEQPTAAWSFEESATAGRDVIFNGDIPCQIHALKDGTLINWGWNSSGTGARKDDDGCKFVFVEAAKMSDVLDNLYEFDTEDLGKVGYYADATIDTYKSAVWAAMTPDQIATAKTAVTSSTVWNMPVSGKAYTFKNVQKDGTTVRWYKYDTEQGKIVLTATEDEATPFVCRLLEGNKYVFVCNDGKYMTWRASVSGYTNGTGVNDAYHGEGRFLTDITIEKMTAGGQIASGVDLSNTRYVSISANRPDKQNVEVGYVVVKKNDGSPIFDGAGAAYYNDNFSSAFIMEEAAFGNAPKVNDVNESDLLSEDLHNTYMATFSATYPTIAPKRVTAYYATKAGELICLNAIAEDEAIPANTGVILVSEEEGNAVMLPAAGETAADVTGNLMAHSAGADKNMTDVANAYLLTDGAQGVGFYRCKGGTLKANKAYLQLPVSLGANALRISFANAEDNEQGDTTDLESVTGNQQPTAVYDLQGRRVMTFGKGLYIVNGKKVIF